MQNREQPELLVGSPPSDEFSSLLSTRAAREVRKLRTEKIEPQVRACVQSYKLQMEMRKHFVHEHPEVSSSWEMPEVQSLINGSQVPKKLLKYFVEVVDGNVTRDLFT